MIKTKQKKKNSVAVRDAVPLECTTTQTTFNHRDNTADTLPFFFFECPSLLENGPTNPRKRKKFHDAKTIPDTQHTAAQNPKRERERETTSPASK
jgi:hypothetical protein